MLWPTSQRALEILMEELRRPELPRKTILAYTEFEFGRDVDGVIRVGDEVLTPDSSRLVAGRRRTPMELRQLRYLVALADERHFGRPQPSFDKQFVEALAGDLS